MKKLVQLVAILLGGIAIVFGLNACSDNDDDKSQDCCKVEFSGIDAGVSYRAQGEVCEDGRFELEYINSEGDRYTEQGSQWRDIWIYDTWKDIEEEYCITRS